MPEKVLVESLKQPGKIVKLGPTVAAHLVKHGSHRYVTRDESAEVETDPLAIPRQPRKKRAYKRRDMKAEE